MARLAGGLVALTSAGCGSSSGAQGDAVTLGLLLPFTGTNSATTSNFERAVIFAASRVNDGGGIAGVPLRVVSKDTHSELSRSQAAAEALIAAGAKVVIGPESADIASAIMPTLEAHGVTLLSPLVGAADDAAVACSSPWFRLAPSALSLGDGLAKQVSAEQIATTAVLYETDAYDEALHAAVVKRFRALGGRVTLEVALDGSAQSYSSEVTQTIAANVDAVVLATSPRTAALVVNEFDALSPSPPRWFLSPLLKTDLLVQNVAPDALEGAMGVAPKVYDDSDAFPNAFAGRWQGDQPLEGAYFYYDAVGLAAFALEEAAQGDSSNIDQTTLRTAIPDIADTRGESFGWNDIEAGLAGLRNDADNNYSGLTGPLLLSACGVRKLGAFSTWQVRSGAIENTAF
jgi:ABC-type branched-subunit amino acid transport system substrate-binding protein